MPGTLQQIALYLIYYYRLDFFKFLTSRAEQNMSSSGLSSLYIARRCPFPTMVFNNLLGVWAILDDIHCSFLVLCIWDTQQKFVTASIL